MYRKTLCVMLVLCTTSVTHAEDELPFIVVESSRINNAADIDPSQSTGPVRIVDRNDFDNRTANLADVLGSQTGVQIRQGGGLGSSSAISIRGSTSRQVQVILDGMVLNDPVTGGVDLGKLSLNDIQRIQVYPSGAPAQLAQTGIGGTVVLETLGKDLEDTTRINLGAGSFDTFQTGLYRSGSTDDVYYWLSLDRQSSDNDFEYPNALDWFNPNDGSTTTRRNAEFEQDSFSAKLGRELSETSQVDALIQYSHHEQGIPTIQNWRDNNASLDNETLRLQLHYREQGWLDGAVHSSHRLVAGDISERYDNRTGRVGLGSSDVSTDTRQLGLINTVSVLLANHTLTTSVDVSHFDFKQINTLNTTSPDNRDRLQIASALSHQWRTNDGRWQTQAALRHYITRDDSNLAQGDGNVTSTTANSDYTGWQLGLSHIVLDNWTLSGNVARSIRIPTLQELYGQQGLFVGNDELNPEESLDYDLSLRTDRGWGHAEVTGYFRTLDPAVVATYDARGVGRYVNLEAEIYGVELDGSIRIADWWSVFGNATFQESENTDDSNRVRYQKQLPGIYHESWLIGSQWHLRPFTFELTYQRDDKLYYDSANILPADPRKTLNAVLRWVRIWQNRSQSELALEVRNLSDELYQDYNRFPGPGRSWFVNLKHTF
ncbi:TonB-dependent receptor [Marinobacter sp. F3R08]|uniref:TonB-dependent receptor n=1 Tax=Marinobacter sp. F3R08 TaxID=2841559 RepID=UPI001C0865EF|nr:TonB-dependent receptor [Marinobacter sp. F3R08]MBU2955007.1 TonB-dependent receptor [Marinobacter sp. F3R08]